MKRKTKTLPLEQMLDGLAACLTAESAKRILNFAPDAKLQKQLDQLEKKHIAGTITPYESSEYEYCIALADFVDLLKSRIQKRRGKES